MLQNSVLYILYVILIKNEVYIKIKNCNDKDDECGLKNIGQHMELCWPLFLIRTNHLYNCILELTYIMYQLRKNKSKRKDSMLTRENIPGKKALFCIGITLKRHSAKLDY